MSRNTCFLPLASLVLCVLALDAGAQTEPVDSVQEEVVEPRLDPPMESETEQEIAAEPVPEFERPKFTFLRSNEDWSGLADADPAGLTDFWDPIKHVKLSEDGSVWASFGGHMRFRLESWSNFGFVPANDDTFLLWRLLLHTDVHIGENVRVFVEGKSAQSTDRDLPGGHRTLDVDSLDLEQAFIDLELDLGDGAAIVIRPGRQVYLFGKQRLVSPLPWANTLRRWDGVTAILKAGDWIATGFWSQFVPVQKYEFNTADSQTQFFGVYATNEGIFDSAVGLDLYFLGLDVDDPVTYNGTTGSEERYTVGGRLFGKLGESGFDYDFEGAYQFGEVGPGDVDAFMIGTQIGYTASELWSTPRFFASFEFGSGDDSPGGDVQTFNQLFPLGHAYLGYIDAIGRQNIIGPNVGVTFKPMPKMTVGVTGNFFWRDSDADAVYNAGGGVVRPGGAGTSSEIGQELDITLKYAFSRHLNGLFGYSRFFAGDFIEESGPDDDIDFLYAQLQYTF